MGRYLWIIILYINRYNIYHSVMSDVNMCDNRSFLKLQQKGLQHSLTRLIKTEIYVLTRHPPPTGQLNLCEDVHTGT